MTNRALRVVLKEGEVAGLRGRLGASRVEALHLPGPVAAQALFGRGRLDIAEEGGGCTRLPHDGHGLLPLELITLEANTRSSASTYAAL